MRLEGNSSNLCSLDSHASGVAQHFSTLSIMLLVWLWAHLECWQIFPGIPFLHLSERRESILITGKKK